MLHLAQRAGSLQTLENVVVRSVFGGLRTPPVNRRVEGSNPSRGAGPKSLSRTRVKRTHPAFGWCGLQTGVLRSLRRNPERSHPMPRPANTIPKLCRHRASARGVVRLNGHDHYCGPWPADHAEAPADTRAAYDRLVAEWLARGRRPEVEPLRSADSGPAPVLSVNELLLAFWNHAQ